MPTPHNLHEEIAALRTTIRYARRALTKPNADPVAIGRTISRATVSLLNLLELQHKFEKQERFSKIMAAHFPQPTSTPDRATELD